MILFECLAEESVVLGKPFVATVRNATTLRVMVGSMDESALLVRFAFCVRRPFLCGNDFQYFRNPSNSWKGRRVKVCFQNKAGGTKNRVLATPCILSEIHGREPFKPLQRSHDHWSNCSKYVFHLLGRGYHAQQSIAVRKLMHTFTSRSHQLPKEVT